MTLKVNYVTENIPALMSNTDNDSICYPSVQKCMLDSTVLLIFAKIVFMSGVLFDECIYLLVTTI